MCPQPGSDPSLWDEDCLQLNVWIPSGIAPSTGWPVLFWIHGGFLQFGEPGSLDPCAMLHETACKAIIVTPGYRLNIFGFLASPELVDAGCDVDANNGFWDQRLALEWTWQNISYFGGDASNITIGGYSAGSHSTFQQLAYDLGVPEGKGIARRALMLSNGPGMQPKSMEDAQLQFDELLEALEIPTNMTPTEKLATLRSLAPKTLIDATNNMKYHQFRGVTDGTFIRHGLLNELDTGLFAQRMKRRNIKLIMGECRDEHFVYGEWRKPANSYESLFYRLQADYPLAACKALMEHYFPERRLPVRFKDWQDAFGYVYADIQIHHLERGMASALVQHGAGHLLYRYRVEWRAQCCDKNWPREFGVTHGTDMASIWFWGDGERLSNKEKILVKKAFHEQFARFIKGQEVEWGTEHALRLRTLKPDGKIEIEKDTRLEEGLKVWDLLKKVGATGYPVVPKL
jgi:carboxylesterase type B